MENSRIAKLFKSKTASLIIALIVMFLWGSLFPMIKIGYRELAIDTSSPASILLFAGVRFAVCGIALILIFNRKGTRIITPTKASIVPIIVVALTAYALHYTCTYIGLSHLESSKTSILKQIGTLFIICFAFLFRKEDRFTPAKLLGGILGFASILVVNMKGLSVSLTIYDSLIIIASFSSVVSTVVAKNAYDHISPLTVTAWAQTIGGVVLLTLGLLMGGKFGKFDFYSVLSLLYICFASSMAYCLWSLLLKFNDMSRLNTIKFAETLFAAICSWILLGENIFRIEYLIAFILVCVGIMIGNGTLGLKKKEANK